VLLSLLEAGKHLPHSIEAPSFTVLAGAGRHDEVLDDVQRGEDMAALGDVSDTQLRNLMRGQARDLGVAVGDGARSYVRRGEAHHAPAQARLSHAVAAQKRDERAIGDLEADAAQDLGKAVRTFEIVHA
jgi:hypothetical protein